MTSRLLVAGALAGLGLALTACNGDDAAQAVKTETVTAGADQETAASPAADDSTEDAGNANAGAAAGQLPDNWPDTDFPIPPGTTVQTQGQDADEIGIVLVGKDPAAVATFYRSALPAAGYKITEDNSVSVGGRQIVGMKFDGHGYHGEIAVVAGHVAISLEQL
ncbi:MAG TPA: hypothetical protein VGP26_03785 [Actinophytocola sp.]|jgi:hypothetical protein|nr:hypothetical protein [Actinophytocola sp.]